jgi:2-hydroxychromene-2-carboxylate isomerase
VTRSGTSGIDFWIALSSPSAYLASLRVDLVGRKHGLPVRWRPFNIRKALEAEGIKPNVQYERKGDYARHDWERTARLHGHRYKLPNPFGRSSLPATAIAYWAEAEQGHDALKDFCRAVMSAYFAENRAIDDAEILAGLAEQCGLDPRAARAAIDDAAAIAAVDAVTNEAIEKGIWGAPFMVVDGEMFWGEDRIEQLDLWIERGGW